MRLRASSQHRLLDQHCQPLVTSARPRPPLLRALGAAEPPPTVWIEGARYVHLETFKHDSWAATALYTGRRGRVVCKFNRQQPIFGLPMRWAGRWLARRETTFLRRLGDVDNVPRWSGTVYVKGRPLAHAVAHEFIPGRPLGREMELEPDFFYRLRQLLDEIHNREMACVDLHKRENVLVGDDGEPYLFDFQISFALPSFWPANSWPARLWLRLLQRSDDYHYQKHLNRFFADVASDLKRPWWIRLHRLLAVPLRTCRRRLLVALGVRGRSGRVTTEHAPEVAWREQPPRPTLMPRPKQRLPHVARSNRETAPSGLDARRVKSA